MLKILNPEFFRFETETIFNQEEGCYFTLISLFTDPKNFELPQYRKVPFASIIIKSEFDYMKAVDEETIIEKLQTSNFKQHSMYTTDNNYERLTSLFKNDNKYHTLIFEQITENRDDYPEKILLIGAIPCNGILRQIKKSEYYKLYNASLIVLKQRPFKWLNGFCDKLLYLLVDIDAYFSFSEFIFTDSENNIRLLNTHHFALNTIFNNAELKSINNIDIVYNKLTSFVLCKGSEERQDLFEYYGKGMFCLSDIPENLSKKGGMMSAKLR